MTGTQGNPDFTLLRQTHNTDTYVLKLLGMSPIVLTPHPNPRLAFTSGMHLEPGNKKLKKQEENMHFHIEIFSKTN